MDFIYMEFFFYPVLSLEPGIKIHRWNCIDKEVD